jgi:hypothetical protein
MNRARFMLYLLLTSAWVGAAGHRALAAHLVPLGPEVEVVTDNAYAPSSVGLAVQPDGSCVFAWNDVDDSGLPLFSDYVPPGGQGPDEGPGYLDTPIGAADVASVIAVTAGRQGFDVIWYAENQFPGEGGGPLFYRTHLDLLGSPVGKPIRLGGAGAEWVWQVRGNGYMAGRWLPSKHGIAARRLTATGQPTGPELLLNSRPIDRPLDVSVLGLSDSSFVAVWLGTPPEKPYTEVVRARRFSPSGKPLGPDFDVNKIPLVLASFYDPDPEIRVAAAPGGGFAVAWQTQPRAYLRRFNAAGTPLGPEVIAMTSGDPDDFDPKGETLQSMAFDDEGNLALLGAAQLQLFDPRGKPLGAPVDVGIARNAENPDLPQEGSLAWTGDSFIAVWSAILWPYDQGTVYLRRFAIR